MDDCLPREMGPGLPGYFTGDWMMEIMTVSQTPGYASRVTRYLNMIGRMDGGMIGLKVNLGLNCD